MAASSTHWWSGWVVCSICDHRQCSAIEIDIEHDEPIVPLECSNCHNMTCSPEDDEDEDEDELI